MEFQEYDDIIRHLAAAIEHQRTINDDLRTYIQEQREFNREQRQINARLETLITEVWHERHNGRNP